MLLIESDGKDLLRSVGVATPEGIVVGDGERVPALPGAGPWVVKAQVPVGGRGKAGGVIRCETETDVHTALKLLLGATIKGHPVRRCLVEAAVAGAEESYLSLMIDPAQYGIRVMLLREGGVDVEEAASVAGRSQLCPPDATAISTAIRDLVAGEPPARRAALIDTGEKLARLFLQHELMLAEINPLFVGPHGCIAGDAKIVIDLNAAERQPDIVASIHRNAAIYPDAIRKLDDGFDYVEVDPEGEIGLLTTGAGLSMMLIDQMTARGGRLLNFCDIRTGLLRGDPTRVVKVLEWVGARPSVKVVLVNIFAGVTDLAEFAELLLIALERTPSIKVPVVARIVGNRFAEARAILAAKRPDIAVEEDLTAALNRVDAILHAGLSAPLPPRSGGEGAGMGGADAQDTPHPTALGAPTLPATRFARGGSAASGPILARLTRRTPVIVQGATGRTGSVHIRRMKEFGTNIVAGVSARAAAGSVESVPVFPDCRAAAAATGAQVSLLMVPPAGVLAAATDAIGAGVKLIVTVAEGVPVHDALRIGRLVREAGAAWVGASTPGLAVPGEMKLGFLPNVSLRPGPLGMMSKSGTLSYEVGYRLAALGLGQSLWVGVGGDPVKGVRFPDLLDLFLEDERTRGIVLIGEVGGSEEEDFADAMLRAAAQGRALKPVYALVAGRGAKEGVAMGHAGALTFGDVGTFASKKQRLEAASAQVFMTIEALIEACRRDF
jgi:succinyl-CoA synthetase alpha subunit/succinyl-CoA synthetase beta subunit